MWPSGTANSTTFLDILFIYTNLTKIYTKFNYISSLVMVNPSNAVYPRLLANPSFVVDLRRMKSDSG